MHGKGRCQLRTLRGAQRCMWQPYRSSDLGTKNPEARVLLVHDAQRRHGTGQKMKICQEPAKISHLPSEPLTSIISPWLFQQWGLDILRPLPIKRGQCKFTIAGVDYFTKRAEDEPLATITEQKVRNFVWHSIICKFGIPKALVSDNGKQFDNMKFKNFCAEL